MVNCSMNVKKRKESKLKKEECSPTVDSVDLDVAFTNNENALSTVKAFYTQ